MSIRAEKKVTEPASLPKTRWQYKSRIARLLGVDAIVLYPFIFTRFKSEDVTPRLIAHELEHVRQIRHYGVLGFYARYLALYFIGLKRHRSHAKAYWLHPFEVAARAAE